MDKISDIMGRRDRHRELEVYLTTIDGAQHLRLHAWLKRNDTLIRSENVINTKEYFGTFMVYITDNQLSKLKENNTESDLYMDLDVMSTESERWGLIKNIEKEDKETERENLLDKIQDFMFSFQIENKEDIDKYLKQANETSLSLFKKSNEFVKDYIKSPELSHDEKNKDLDLMIEAFEGLERYEDCAFLVKIKNKIKKYYNKQKTKSYE